MLNKKVCKSCFKNREGQIDMDAPIAIRERIIWAGWLDGDDGDEGCWKEGFVYCPYNERLKIPDNGHAEHFSAISIYGNPPSWCPYACEHLVSQK